MTEDMRAQAGGQDPPGLHLRRSQVDGLPQALAEHGHGRGPAQLPTSLVDSGTSPISLKATFSGLRFFFDITLGRVELMARMQPVKLPRTVPDVLCTEEATQL